MLIVMVAYVDDAGSATLTGSVVAGNNVVVDLLIKLFIIV